jgi:hypothetical protein
VVTLPDEYVGPGPGFGPESGFPGHGTKAGVTDGEFSGYCDRLATLDMRTVNPTTDTEFTALRTELETVGMEAPAEVRDHAQRWSTFMAYAVDESQRDHKPVSDTVRAALRQDTSFAGSDSRLASWVTDHCVKAVDE